MDTVRELTIGRVTVRMGREFDDSPDTSWLGKLTDYRLPHDGQWLYDMETGDMQGPDGLWRDKRGRITGAGKREDGRREYRFILTDNDRDCRYARMDAERLEAVMRGDIWFEGVIVTVEIKGREIGRASVWGIESDSGDYFLETERELAHEAISDARRWFKSLVA